MTASEMEGTKEISPRAKWTRLSLGRESDNLYLPRPMGMMVIHVLSIPGMWLCVTIILTLKVVQTA